MQQINVLSLWKSPASLYVLMKISVIMICFFLNISAPSFLFFFFLIDPAPPEISPLPLHAALPIFDAGEPLNLARQRLLVHPLRVALRGRLDAHLDVHLDKLARPQARSHGVEAAAKRDPKIGRAHV